MTIREAVLADAAGIARVHVESWRTTYPGIMPQEHLDSLSIAEREEKWQGILSPDSADVTCTFVAETEGSEIVGFTEGGRDRSGGPDFQAEIYVIYLLKSQQGFGIGRRLLQTAARRLHADGYSRLFLWVSALNHPACRFYEAVGGVPVRTGQRTNHGITYDDIGYGWNQAALLRLIRANLPSKLIANNCAAASDGGSLYLFCVDPEQTEYGFHLNWSLEAQAKETMQLSVNHAAVPKGTPEEKEWLDLLANADVQYRDTDAPSKDYSDSVRSVLDQILLRVRSDAYQQRKGIHG